VRIYIHINTLDVHLIYSNTHQQPTIMSTVSLPFEADILACATLLSPSDHGNKVVKLSDTLVAKYGSEVYLVEAETMQYIAENSDVPLPKVHGTLTNPVTKHTYIIMDLVQGQTLEDLLPSLTKTEKDDIAQLIKIAVDKLHAMPEPGYLGGVGRKPCTSGILHSLDGPIPSMSGPFENEAAFNEGLLLRVSTAQGTDPPFMRFLRTLFSQGFAGHKTVMTHGDLQPKNIMVQRIGSKEDGSGSFTISLIDWETAGWYPEYWDFCMSTLMGRYRPNWQEMTETIMPLVYGYEHALMQMVFHILYY
jgi:serine/threonine protein kinase